MAFSDLVASVDSAARAHLGGVAVNYAPGSGDPVDVVGIFDANFVLAEADAELGVELVGPAVFLRVDELPTDPDSDDPAITVAGQTYSVRARRRDSLGGIVLMLHRADL